MDLSRALTTGRPVQPSTRQLKAKEIRARILRAAREVLAERGFSLDVIELTRRAGVGSGTVYRYFDSKEGLIRAVVEELVTKTREELREIAQTLGDARTDIKRTMTVGFTRVREYGQLPIALVAGTQPRQYRDLLGQPAQPHQPHPRSVTDRSGSDRGGAEAGGCAHAR